MSLTKEEYYHGGAWLQNLVGTLTEAEKGKWESSDDFLRCAAKP